MQDHVPAMWLRKAYLAFHRRVNALMLGHGITADQFLVLRLAALEPGITQIMVVKRATSDANTVAAIVRLLERRGLLRREIHPEDGRARCLFLTRAGRQLERRTFEACEPLRGALRSCMGRDTTTILRFLQRVDQVFSAPLEPNGKQLPSISTQKAIRRRLKSA